MRDYFPIRDSKRLECVKSAFKGRNSTALSKFSIFSKYANSNKMSGPLHVRIIRYIIY